MDKWKRSHVGIYIYIYVDIRVWECNSPSYPSKQCVWVCWDMRYVCVMSFHELVDSS